MTLQVYSAPTQSGPLPPGCYNYPAVIRKSCSAPLPRSAGVTLRPLTLCKTCSSAAAIKPQRSVGQRFLEELGFFPRHIKNWATGEDVCDVRLEPIWRRGAKDLYLKQHYANVGAIFNPTPHTESLFLLCVISFWRCLTLTLIQLTVKA